MLGGTILKLVGIKDKIPNQRCMNKHLFLDIKKGATFQSSWNYFSSAAMPVILCHSTPRFWQIGSPYFNQRQIMLTTLLLAPPNFQTFLRLCSLENAFQKVLHIRSYFGSFLKNWNWIKFKLFLPSPRHVQIPSGRPVIFKGSTNK